MDTHVQKIDVHIPVNGWLYLDGDIIAFLFSLSSSSLRRSMLFVLF